MENSTGDVDGKKTTERWKNNLKDKQFVEWAYLSKKRHLATSEAL